jgi:hypothetical protein
MSIGSKAEICPVWMYTDPNTNNMNYGQMDVTFCENLGLKSSNNSNGCYIAHTTNGSMIAGFSDNMSSFKSSFPNSIMFDRIIPAYSSSNNNCLYSFTGNDNIPPAVLVSPPIYGFPIQK